MMRYDGRERRRKGGWNRVRRVLYAVLLWASPQAAVTAADAADEPAPAQPLRGVLSIESLPLSGSPFASKYIVSFSALDPRIASPFQKVAELLGKRSWQFNDTMLSLRGGVAFDIDLPDAGKLHLSLFPDEDRPDRGKRWRVAGPERSPRGNLWSFGGSIDLVRTESDPRVHEIRADRELAVVPQLILDMDRLAGMPGSAQMTLQHANWRDGVTERYSESRCWQVLVNWRF